MKKIQTGDNVIVIAGKTKGAKSVVIAVSDTKVKLKGVNIVKKAVKGQGFVEKEAWMDISNIAHFDAKADAPSRVGIKEEKGKKVRFYKKSGAVIKKAA